MEDYGVAEEYDETLADDGDNNSGSNHGEDVASSNSAKEN